ncbi:MAG: hypothetical protein INQ03_08680 [Candidatus Heimdallarchaeota archaeon]|nr:hypothetical protein [Candidatus Heimdallarchaeota archaeon]
MNDLKEVLSKVGLSEDELAVYNVVVAFGLRTAGQIASYTNQDFHQVQKTCASLIDKKYLIKVDTKLGKGGLGNQYIPLAPKISISGDISKRLSERLNKLSKDVSNLWEDTQGIINEDTSKLISKVEDVLNNNAKELETLGDEQLSSIDSWSSDLVDELKTISEDSYGIFKTQVTEPLVTLAAQLRELASKMGEMSDSSVVTIQSKTDEHKVSIETAVNSIKNELEEFADEIVLLMMGRISGLNQQLEQSAAGKSEEGEQIFAEMHTLMKELISQQEGRIKSIDSNLADSYESSFNESKQSLFDVVEDIKTKFGDTILSAVTSGNKAQEDAINSSRQLLDRYKDAQIGSVDDLHKSFLASIDQVQQDAVVELTKILEQTGADLNSLETSITENLNSHQGKLNDDLSNLSKTVGETLKARFKSVKDKLAGFINDLKSSSSSNVSEIIASINELSEFLKNFLIEVNDTLSAQLESLKEKVGSDIADIVKSTDDKIAGSLSKNKEDIQKINDKITADLDKFQQAITTFLQNVKSDLENKLKSAQNDFQAGVDKGVESYKKESLNVSSLQEKQMKEIETEADELLKMADKSRNEIQNLADTTMNSIKNENSSKFKDNIVSNIDKFNRQFNSYNETMIVDFNKFKDNFVEQSTGLRERVPEEINNTFTDEIDRMMKFKSDFERITTFIDQSYGKLEDAFSSDSKFNYKKERETYHQEIMRNRDEFKRLGKNINDHFSSSIDGFEDTKDNLLEGMNKTVQDELVNLEELIENKNNETEQLMTDFKSKLGSSKDSFVEDINTNLTELMRNISADISSNLLSIFQQPLDSIISKARSVATGTEGVDQENRILKSQNMLIGSIQEAVDSLVGSLQTAFENSIAELDSRVSGSIEESQGIVNTLKTDMDTSFKSQNDTASNFASDLNASLKQVENSLNDNLSDTISNTKKTVGDTVDTKKKEISDTVNEKTGNLQNATDAKLVEVDESFVDFKSQLDSIQQGTNDNISHTVNTTIKGQQKSMHATLKSLSDTIKSGTETLKTTETSLQGSVNQPLTKIREDVSGMIDQFNKSTENAKDIISKEIDKYYAKTSDHLNSIKDMNTKLIDISQTFNEDVNALEETQKQAISAQFSLFKENREADTAKFFEDLNSKGTELNEKMHEFIQESFSQMAEQLSMLQQEVLTSIENVKSNIDLTVTNSVETVRTDILGPANEVVNAIMQQKDDTISKLTGMADEFEAVEGNQHKVIGDSNTEFVSTLNKSIEKETEKWKSKTDKIYSGHVEKNRNLAGDFASQISDVSTKGQKKITDTLNTIPSTIDETLDASAKSMALLNEISAGSVKLEPKYPELSYFDASKEAIIATLNGVLLSTKSSATIFTPSLEWLDLSLIDKWVRTTVTIVTDPTQHSLDDTKRVEEIKNKIKEMANIRLKKLDKNRIRDKVDVIMITRDKEEFVLSKMLSEKDPYAFVTQDETFVDKFGELINVFATMPNL